MNDTWQDGYGNVWYGYWHRKLDGTWGYLMHNSNADNDMGDIEIHEVETSFGLLDRGTMVEVPDIGRTRKVFKKYA